MTYYDEKYFEWQKDIGIIGGYLNKFKFEQHVKESDVLMDFGCGGGYLLSNFKNPEKFGFEINRHAWKECERNGVRVVDSFKDIEESSVDTIISNHALEHVPLPLETLKDLQRVLKPGGKIVIVLPCEQPSESGFHYRPGDINQHLHTWCPMTFGNLCTLAGIDVISCKTLQHQWCPDFKTAYKSPDFHERCIEHAKRNNNLQIRMVGTK